MERMLRRKDRPFDDLESTCFGRAQTEAGYAARVSLEQIQRDQQYPEDAGDG
jgi:hypothetical protein